MTLNSCLKTGKNLRQFNDFHKIVDGNKGYQIRIVYYKSL